MRHLREIHREPILTWDTWKMKHSSNGGYKSIVKKPKNRRLKRTSIALNVKILSKGRDSSWNMKSTSCSYIFSSGLEEYCISSEKSLVCKKRGVVHFCMKPCTQKLKYLLNFLKCRSTNHSTDVYNFHDLCSNVDCFAYIRSFKQSVHFLFLDVFSISFVP